jgi:hypothetical protein
MGSGNSTEGTLVAREASNRKSDSWPPPGSYWISKGERSDRESVVGEQRNTLDSVIATVSSVERSQVGEKDDALVLTEFAVLPTNEKMSNREVCLPAPAEHCRELDAELSLVGSATDNNESRVHRVARFRQIREEFDHRKPSAHHGTRDMIAAKPNVRKRLGS